MTTRMNQPTLEEGGRVHGRDNDRESTKKRLDE